MSTINKKLTYGGIALFLVIGVVFLSKNNFSSLPKLKQEPISIITATDMHFISPTLNDNGSAFMTLMGNSDGRVSHYVNEITDAFVEEIIKSKPELLILSGDISFNGEKKSHEDFAIKLQKIKDTGIEVLLIPGNHDIWNMDSIEFTGNSIAYVETASQEQFYEIYKNFGYQNASSRDVETLSYIYPIRKDLKVLMLDANTDMTENVVLSSTVEWLEKELKKAQWYGEKVIAVTHQNVLNHNKVINDGYSLLNASQIAEMFRKYDVEYILSGHIHLQDIKSEDNLTEIVTSSLVVNPNQYGVVTYDGENFKYNTKFLDVNTWAREQGITNTDLLNFTEYSKEYFIKSAYDSAYKKALEQNINEADAKSMAEFYSYLNSNYFAGAVSDITPYAREIELWEATQGRFSDYIKSMLSEASLNKQLYN